MVECTLPQPVRWFSKCGWRVLANNVANINTIGFKGEKPVFQGTRRMTANPGSSSRQPIEGVQHPVPLCASFFRRCRFQPGSSAARPATRWMWPSTATDSFPFRPPTVSSIPGRAALHWIPTGCWSHRTVIRSWVTAVNCPSRKEPLRNRYPGRRRLRGRRRRRKAADH